MDEMDAMKRLSIKPEGYMTEPPKSKLQRLLDERISMTEAISLAAQIVASYPGGDKATEAYLGAIAATLQKYPASIARQCASLDRGMVCEARGYPLPQIADVVAWCEAKTEPLRVQIDTEKRRAQQFADRDDYLARESFQRPRRLTIEQLKEKYGDWHNDWKEYHAEEVPTSEPVTSKRYSYKEFLEISKRGEVKSRPIGRFENPPVTGHKLTEEEILAARKKLSEDIGKDAFDAIPNA